MHRFRHLSLNHRVRTLNGYGEPGARTGQADVVRNGMGTHAGQPAAAVHRRDQKRAIYRRLR
jgi:hypothetical protein